MLILDTAAWLSWTSEPSRIPPKTARAIADAEKQNELVVSAISVSEVATKVALGKLELDREVTQWIKLASSHPGLVVIPVDPADALQSATLPGDFPGDATDRLIVALARRLDCPIVTSDKALRAYRHVKTIW